jgi:hypothetical protein
MELRSSAFDSGGQIPIKYTRDGQNVSPPLRWSDLPEGTEELALIFENVTPETKEPFVQWVVYKISSDREGLPAGLEHKRDPEEPADVLHGRNDLDKIGYDGPQGSVGRKYNYTFHLYALDEPLDVEEGLEKDELLEAMSDHVLEEAELTTTWERPREG